MKAKPQRLCERRKPKCEVTGGTAAIIGLGRDWREWVRPPKGAPKCREAFLLAN